MNFQDVINVVENIAPIKILFTAFALFAWSRAFLVFRQKKFNIKEITFWTIFWFSAIIIVFIPGKSGTLAQFLGMGRGFDALIFISVIALFYAIYRLYAKVNEFEEIITSAIRSLALKNIKKKK